LSEPSWNQDAAKPFLSAGTDPEILSLGVQIPTKTKHEVKKLKMVHAFTPIKVQIDICRNSV
jgi:hypothetical protein